MLAKFQTILLPHFKKKHWLASESSGKSFSRPATAGTASPSFLMTVQSDAGSQTTARCGKATPAIAELWNVFQRSVPNRSPIRMARQGGQRNREGATLSHGGAVECIPTLHAHQGILQSVAGSYATAGMASRHSKKNGVIVFHAINRSRVHK